MGILQDATQALGFGTNPGGNYAPAAHDNQSQQMLNSYANDPSKQWSHTQASNPYLSQLFGQGGAYDAASKQATDPSQFGLQNSDYTAYGQASDNLARMFGGQENQLANSLSNRGFGGMPSGVAGAQFSGLQGNKNEMLAQSQQQIAQARMQFAQNSVNQARQFMTGAAGAGNQAVANNTSMLSQGANAYDKSWSTANDAWFGAHQDNAKNTTPTLGQMFGSGIGAGVAGLGKNLIGGGSDALGGSQGLGGLGGGGSGPAEALNNGGSGPAIGKAAMMFGG